ncbi:hypothetical protein F511_19972 [Dorcoceras hygrometricum]|uniref:Uncharacterized protein n=1 Tax=Dorcoceras hygrometricum TaxID=472368 RepID=A0A2Z7DAR8_9LAMI|nr:hypothetical protein F511_19972 [Dorcoceras hygrometricum]
MQGIKAATESREPKDLNNSSTARSDQRNNQFVATGILSTWELHTHLQYTIPDANNQLHLLFLTHEMWELPTPLIAANKPSREIEVRELPAQPPRYTGTIHSSLNIASWYSQFNRLHTHLQYTIPDANNQLHLLFLTHEMWELPTPLIAANKPSREIEVRELPAQPPRYTGTIHSSLNIASWYSQFNRTCIASKTGLDTNMRVCNATTDIITQAQIRQSGPRPDPRLLRQTALEVLTRSARSDSPRKTRPEQIPAKWRRRRRRKAAAAAAATAWEEKRGGG